MKKLIICLCLFFTFSSVLLAEAPNEIRYNGRLKSYQTPVNGSMNMVFKLYEQESGGNSIWTSNTVNIAISSGIFTYTLKPTGIDWKKKDIWLELTVGTNIMSPREKLMSQPYALHATNASNGVPPGTIIAYGGKNVPQGYLLCDGRTVSTSDYPELYQAIETIYGGNSSNFKLPDLRGMFLRGEGSQAVNYPNTYNPPNTTYASAPLGAFQGDTIRNITGTIGGGTAPNCEFLGEVLYANGAFTLGQKSEKMLINGAGSNQAPSSFNFNASGSVPSGNENRPANYAVKYCIKY